MAVGKERHCFYCGESLGFIENRFWCAADLPTCGKRECEREARDAHEAEREEAHEQLDRDRGWR